MPYQVEGSSWKNIFAVPGSVVDDHIKLTGGASLKVLLVFLRRGGNSTPGEIAAFLNLPLADVLDAFNYWTHLGVLTLLPEEEDALPGALETRTVPKTGLVYTIAPNNSSHPQQAQPKKSETQPPAKKPGSERKRLTTGQINEMSRSDQNISYLLQEAQSVLGKPLSPVATDTITSLYSYYGMQPDLVLMLLQYCLSLGKDNMRYVEKVAAGWIESGIDTHEKAEREIMRAMERSTVSQKVRKLFGITDRVLIASEMEHIRVWTEELHCSMDLISLAYERTIEQKGKLSFPYITGILQSWSSKGITDIRQATEDMKRGKRKAPGVKQPEPEASYDMGELERLITYGEV